MPVAAVILVFSIVLGLAALGLVAFTVYEQVRSLGRTVARASDRLAAVSPPQIAGHEADEDAFGNP